jgi:hypothetical protein
MHVPRADNCYRLQGTCQLHLWACPHSEMDAERAGSRPAQPPASYADVSRFTGQLSSFATVLLREPFVNFLMRSSVCMRSPFVASPGAGDGQLEACTLMMQALAAAPPHAPGRNLVTTGREGTPPEKVLDMRRAVPSYSQIPAASAPTRVPAGKNPSIACT